MCGVDCSNVNQTVSTGTKDFENNPQALYYSILLFFDFLVDMVDKGEKCPKYQAFPRQPAVNQSVNQTVNRWLFRMEVPFAGLLLP